MEKNVNLVAESRISCVRILVMELEKVLRMNGGQGESSYARNSCFQEISLGFLHPFLEECIHEMKLMVPCERFCIADLGCSAGPNTFVVAEAISVGVQRKYAQALPELPTPELQVFFADLPCNDFNLLFSSMPPAVMSSNMKQEEGEKLDMINGHNDSLLDDDGKIISTAHQEGRRYFAAGVAGSFHTRLFPTNSLHFVYSSYSLHWLSRVPIEIKDKSSRSWNGKRVFISNDGPMEVAEAYLAQFQRDFSSFLTARAQEIVKGGCMFIYLSGRDTADPRHQGASGVIGDILEAAFNDILSQGLIEEEKLHSFNLPFFAPCAEELIAEFEKEGSFIIKRILFLSGVVEKVNQQGCMDIGNMDKCQAFGKMVAKQFRAILEGLVTAHFGREIVEPLFEKFALRAADNISKLWKSNIKGGGILAIVERA